MIGCRQDPSRTGLGLVLVLVAALSVAPLVALAGQEPTGRSEAEVEAIGSRLDRELMSPFCQGLTLENCPTSGAAELRREIRVWLREGRSEEWIRETLVSRFGEGILGAPRFRGIGILAWVLPGVALLVAAVGVGLWMRRHTERGDDAAVEAPPDDERRRAAAARVERDLETLDSRGRSRGSPR